MCVTQSRGYLYDTMGRRKADVMATGSEVWLLVVLGQTCLGQLGGEI